MLEPDSPIVGVSFLPTEQTGESVDDKGTRLDVRVELADGTQVDIEMQNARREAQRRRALYYWSRMYQAQLHQGQDYSQLRPCVIIWFYAYPELPGDRFHSIFRVQEGCPLL